jgi:hypothetical protein
LCGAEPALKVEQVPGFAARSHASHVPVQALSQQMPSGEQVVPPTQSVAVDWQSWPFFFLQAPEASQVPAHTLFGSSWFLAATQVWSAPQVMQVPVQSEAAQQPTGGGSMHWLPQLTLPEGQVGAVSLGRRGRSEAFESRKGTSSTASGKA